jgi:hypothetical protein
MSIHDFHAKLATFSDDNVLLRSLRRISLLDDPKTMLNQNDPEADWILWTDGGSPSCAAARA